ncbi:cyclin-dependent protein kinase inhibitor SMR10-like [Cornus florida]|uniref:cyclin-dependent protein kinase inhibitor SMR10-like n=1 Tax=Cornus florida TaxID=4283 RepID=UPI00289DD75F|nr:cyclin-dependent protein kinase inhibitor SMR10-like [Cornus florida]
MAMPNSGKDLNPMEINSLSRPALEIQNGDDQLQEQEHEEEESRKELLLQKDIHEKGNDDQLEISCLEFIKRPSLGEFEDDEEEEEENDGFRTPTCLDQSAPLIPECPPAPRKPKSLPLTKKRKAASRPILLDLSDEVESLFPPPLLADLGSKIKKVKIMNNVT